MANMKQILTAAGLTVTDEQEKAVTKAVSESYKTVEEWQKQVDEVKLLRTTLEDTKKKLSEFDGVDIAAKDKLIGELQESLSQKETEYKNQLAERDFQDLLKECITSAKGKNAKAITALLDLDTLRGSKNQKEDVAAALKKLSETEDSKMLFGDPEPNNIGTGDPIGTVTKKGTEDNDAAMRAVMGLPPAAEQK